MEAVFFPLRKMAKKADGRMDLGVVPYLLLSAEGHLVVI